MGYAHGDRINAQALAIAINEADQSISTGRKSNGP
jgi:hypothetical protein